MGSLSTRKMLPWTFSSRMVSRASSAGKKGLGPVCGDGRAGLASRPFGWQGAPLAGPGSRILVGFSCDGRNSSSRMAARCPALNEERDLLRLRDRDRGVGGRAVCEALADEVPRLASMRSVQAVPPPRPSPCLTRMRGVGAAGGRADTAAGLGGLPGPRGGRSWRCARVARAAASARESGMRYPPADSHGKRGGGRAPPQAGREQVAVALRGPHGRQPLSVRAQPGRGAPPGRAPPAGPCSLTPLFARSAGPSSGLLPLAPAASSSLVEGRHPAPCRLPHFGLTWAGCCLPSTDGETQARLCGAGRGAPGQA